MNEMSSLLLFALSRSLREFSRSPKKCYLKGNKSFKNISNKKSHIFKIMNTMRLCWSVAWLG